MRVFTRLALLGGILSALLLVVGGMGLYGLAATNEALRTVYEAVSYTHLTLPTKRIV